MNEPQYPLYDYENQKRMLIEYSEKRQLRHATWGALVPCMIFFFATLFWVVPIVFIFGLFGIDYQKTVEILTEPAVSQILQAILSLTLLTLPFIICAAAAGVKVIPSAGFKSPKSGTALACLFFGLGFCSFANMAVSMLESIFERLGFKSTLPETENPDGVFGFLLVVISTAVIPALVEEFAFRGIVQGMLKPFGEVFSIVGSAAAFGLLHGNFEQIPFAFLVGLVLGFVRIKTDSLFICMLIHFLNNFISVVISYSDIMPAYVINLIYTVYIMLALTFSVLGLALLKGKENFTFKKFGGEMSTGRIYKRYFFSPAMIIVFLLYFFRALTYVKI